MQVLEILSGNLKKIVGETVEAIKKGGVVVCPTDTVYGLIADATNEIAVKRVFEIKKRFSEKPLPVFVKDLEVAGSLADINKRHKKVLKKFWPGKLTAVLNAKPIKFPEGILSKDGKIGLRMPDYKLLGLLLDEIGCPVTSTSANLSGKQDSVNIIEVLEQFKNEEIQPDLVLDAGKLEPSLSSTVVDLTDFKILRIGMVSEKEIIQAIKG